MRVVIEARLPDPAAVGGVSQAIISLATSLSRLTDCRADEEFIFVVKGAAGNWLDNHVSGPCRLHKLPLTWRNRLSLLPIGRPLRFAANAVRSHQNSAPAILYSDGTAEGLGAQMIHFPTQDAYETGLPNIYQPHDLQHLHLPQFFSSQELLWRDLAYPIYCKKADTILVESSWIKDDVADRFNISPDRIAVCPFPPPTFGYREPANFDAIKRKLRYDRFIFYPAQTWPHKNHLKLFEALALLKKERGIKIPLVCTGKSTDFLARIESALSQLELADQVQFLGFLPEAEIKALYRVATALVIPTKFESISFPIWEAFEAGLPVACSNVTSLPRQVGNAGLLFDPDDTVAIADALQNLWENEGLRNQLVNSGTERLRIFSRNSAGMHIRALYRRIAGELTQQDNQILGMEPAI
jgi:glycosyltransferase involved in cell wall biosynthesis